MRENYEAWFVPYEFCSQTGSGNVLIFAPHPDDEVIGCGGAIVQHVQNSVHVHVVIVTDGMLGDPGLADKIRRGMASEKEIEHYITTRQNESRRAGEVLGYGKPLFWGIPDRQLIYNESMVARVFDAINQIKPSIIYCPSIYEMHPDHRDLALSVLEAVRRLKLRPDLFMYEIGRPMPSPDILCDITDQWENKFAAVRCFDSQLSVCPLDKYISALNYFRTYTLPDNIKKAEAYIVIRGNDFNKRSIDLLEDELRDKEKRFCNHKSFRSRFVVLVRALKQLFFKQ